MAASFAVRSVTVRANNLEFGVLEAGSGPLALCLQGFPDCAHTWRHLLPALARAGFHAVAPSMRGYAPTEVPADGAYQLGALIADAAALHDVLGGDGDAVLIGHDWGAEAAYGAAAYAPDRWRRFFYLFMFRDPLGLAEAVLASDGMSFLDQLWHDWSPGFQPGGHLDRVKESLREPANLAAAVGYYRANPAGAPGALGTASRYAGEEQAAGRQAPQPTLYLHGARDGCIGADLAREAEGLLAPSSRLVVVEDAGHFLHLEKPGEVNDRILAWVS